MAREVAGTSKTTPCGAVGYVEDAKISCLEMAPASVQEFVAHVFCRPPLAEVDTHWSMVHSTYPLCKIGVGAGVGAEVTPTVGAFVGAGVVGGVVGEEVGNGVG